MCGHRAFVRRIGRHGYRRAGLDWGSALTLHADGFLGGSWPAVSLSGAGTSSPPRFALLSSTGA